MHELKRAEFGRVRPLFRSMDHHLAVQAILDGSVRAPVYVDHAIHPRAALTWTGHRLYLAAPEPDPACYDTVRQLLLAAIRRRALQMQGKRFMLYYAPGAWEQPIHSFLEGRSPVKAERQFYTLQELQTDWRLLLPEGFALETVDRALLDRTHLQNLDALTDEMCSERESVADFLEKSFGVCLVRGDEIVGWCLSEYNSRDRCEVGIQTLEPYRRRGFATLMATALVEHALSQGISQVGWHCHASNRGSVATARKAGFEKVVDYPVYLACFDMEAEGA